MTFSGVQYHQSRLTQFQIETAGEYQHRVHRFTRFLGLDDENLRLNQEIAALKKQLSNRDDRTDSLNSDFDLSESSIGLTPQSFSAMIWPDSGNLLDFVAPARVIYCGHGNQQNYLLLDRGLKHGIRPKMAVIQGNRIVGQIQAVSEHFARAVPLLNIKLRTSALHPKSQTVGTLAWNGESNRYAELLDFPIHIPIKIGDSLVTSSYSAVYPPGLRLGRIDRIEVVPGAVTYKIRVLLTTDFSRLDHVQIIRPSLQAEREGLLRVENN